MKRMKGFNRFLTAIIFALAALLSAATAAQAMPVPTAAPCFNGVQDADEKGVDCGGSCFSPTTLELCDGIDNNRDCMVDVNCKTNAGEVVGAPAPIKGEPQASQEAKPSCHDGFKNQDELWDDCGGVCVTNETELCDGVDNNRNCIIDEAEECGITPAQQVYLPEVIGVPTPDSDSKPTPVSAPIPEPESQPVPESVPVSTPAGEAASYPAAEAPSYQPAVAGSLDELDAEQTAAAAEYIRKFAKEKGIYLPDSEPDAELVKKYAAFAKKHEAEFEAKYGGKELSEKEIAEIVKQFSDEAYPKPVEQKPQSQSFFSKVASFFKRLFS
ncbi:hypothetical protein HYV85_06670 [Candidatus Woesearchaeota archaeon]|nr:hypothetical protein [Candidatus Woesearchaeota archaeon]